MIKYFCALIFCISTACASSQNEEIFPSSPFEISDLCCPKEKLLSGLVNPLSGQASLRATDLIVKGAQEIRLDRIYIAPCIPANIHSNYQLLINHIHHYRGWQTLSHLNLRYSLQTNHFLIPDQFGSILEFKKIGPQFILQSSSQGMCNLGPNGPTAKVDPRNIRVAYSHPYFIVSFPDGTERRYLKKGSLYQLEKEILSNGKILRYEYDVSTPIQIKSMDPQEQNVYASIDISGHRYSDVKTFSGSNGLQAVHHFKSHDIRAESHGKQSSCTATCKTQNYLAEVESPLREKEKFVYGNDLSLQQIDRKANPVSFSYEFSNAFGKYPHKRVKEFYTKASSKLDNSRAFQDHITVHHADGTKTEHRYNKQLLPVQEKIFDALGNLASTKDYRWSESNKLEEISLCDGHHQLLYQRAFQYDKFGNPVEECLSGHFNEDEETLKIQRIFSQDGRNLLLDEKDSTGKTVKYQYLEGTNLPVSKLTCDDQKILIREFWEYDDCCNLIKTVIDDGSTEDKTNFTGVTERRITSYTLRFEQPYIHMPEWVEEKYFDGHNEQLLQKRHLTYDQYGNISEEKVYDSEGCFAYAITKEYDAAGNLLSETNALGQRAVYTYDENGNRLSAHSFSGDLFTEWHYDNQSHLILEKKTGENYSPVTTAYEYDANDLIVKKTVNHRNTTRYVNDPIALKAIEIESPCIDGIPVKKSFEYNALGHEVSRRNANGHVQAIRSNLYGQPLKISHPDGAHEEFSYSLKGYLIRHVNQEGVAAEYKRDIFGRVLLKTTFLRTGKKLSQETYSYNAFHLLSETDPEGVTTAYQYDGAGRKVREEREERIVEYAYDVFSRLSTKTFNSFIHHFKYDSLDRIIEETKTDLSGTLLQKIAYEYDKNGNRSAIIRFRQNDPAAETYQYDPYGRLISSTDPEGYSTIYHYNDEWINENQQQVLKKTVIEPHGLRTEILFDPYERPVSRQLFDPMGTLLHQDQKQYDPEGNCVLLEETAMNQGEPLRVHKTSYRYDSMNRCAMEIRAEGTTEERITTFSFTPAGKVAEKIRPDGNILQYEYNPLGYLEKLASSDGSIRLTYRTNLRGELIEACDLNQSLTLARSYDAFGNIREESWNRGLFVKKTYDDQNSVLSLEFPGGRIHYGYDPVNLKKVTRVDEEGRELYQHHYDEYDLSGNLLRETLIEESGTVSYETDSLGRKVSVKSPYFSQECFYDPVGNLIETSKDQEWIRFSYDPLSQLISENDDRYEFDSLYNRTSTNGQSTKFNSLSEQQSLSYDLNGNLIHDGHWNYSYDALNRLTKAENQQAVVTFAYDPLGRRISKTAKGETEFYLYDDEQEIGGYSGKNELKQLFVPGLQWKGNSYIPAAIELNGKAYAPIVDAHGNIVKLIDPAVKTAAHQYRFTAFGESLEPIEAVFNPYRFASKRLDPRLNLIYFGQRYYSPALGRWITTDPEGSVDSTNLYQYAFNNPYRYCDPDGRFVFVLAVPIAAASTISLEMVGTAAVAALTAALIYEAVPHIEHWVNQSMIYNPSIFERGYLPAKGNPNSSDSVDWGNGRGTIRYYGPDGFAETDYDFGHDHGAGDPHAHEWDWSKKKPRQEGRPLNSEE